MPFRPIRLSAAAAALLAATSAAPAGTATFPYTELFDAQTASPPATNTAGQKWQQGSNGTWSIAAEAGLDKAYRFVGSQSTAGTALNGVSSFAAGATAPAAGSFSISTEFTLAANGVGTAGDNRVGLALFGTGFGFTGGAADPYYLADVMTANTGGGKIIRIISVKATNAELDGTVTGTFDLGTVYTLTVDGTITGTGGINLTAAVTGGGVTGSTAVFTDAARLTGTNFGYRNRSALAAGATGATSLDVNLDNYRLVVPEPATVGLLGVGTLGLLARRGRRTARWERVGEVAGL